MSTIDVSDEQRFTLVVERNSAVGLRALSHDLLCLGIRLYINDPEFVNVRRLTIAIFDDASVHHVFYD